MNVHRLLIAALISIAIAFGGCAQYAMIPAPTMRPFIDNKDWVLVEDLPYKVGATEHIIVVPQGFVTDFASIPEKLWSFGLSPHGRYSRAAIVHDYLYWSQGCTRKQADNILMIAMKESGVSKRKARTIYTGVDLGGQSSWKDNLNQRNALKPRVIPPEYLAIPAELTWREYRLKLQEQDVRDPAFPANPGYCALGNTNVVEA